MAPEPRYAAWSWLHYFLELATDLETLGVAAAAPVLVCGQAPGIGSGRVFDRVSEYFKHNTQGPFPPAPPLPHQT